MNIPDLIENWRKRRLDGDVSFGVLVDETIDLLTRLTAPDDEGLETTEDDLIALEELERDEYLKGVDIANIDRLIRDFDLLRAKLRAAEKRADIGLMNYKNAWSALQMIREAIEAFGPDANLPSGEGVLVTLGPEPVHEAEALVAALARVRCKFEDLQDHIYRLNDRIDVEESGREHAEARADRYEAALKAIAFGSYSNVSVDSDGSLELAQIASRMQEIARAALNPEPKP
jgi:hypothetical protein